MKQVLLMIAVVALVGCGEKKEMALPSEEAPEAPLHVPPMAEEKPDPPKTTKTCYWCKEEIKVAALVCKHCTSKDPDYSPPVNTIPIVEKAIRESLKKPTGELTVADLASVTVLNLAETKITDAGLKEVAKMQNLTGLSLGYTEITDAGIKELAKLQNLTSLSLSYSYNITDAGLKDIAKLQKLKVLFLYRTNVTDAGVAELQKALPNCDIRR
jgi:hypothetical protein